MKNLLSLCRSRLYLPVLALGLGLHATQAGQSIENENEFLVAFDDGTTFAVVDKASGQVRFGSMTGAGELDLNATLRTGVTGVSDVTSGLQGAVGEALGVTSPQSNEVRFLQPGSSAPALIRFSGSVPEPGFIAEISAAGPGSNQLTVLSSLGDSLTYFEINNDPLANPNELVGGKDVASTGAEPLCVDFTDASMPRFPITLRQDGGSAFPRLLRFDGSELDIIEGPSIPADAVCVPNVGTDDGRFGLLLFVPGVNALAFIEMTDPDNLSVDFTAPVDLDKPGFPVGQVIPVDLGGAPGILVISQDGQIASQFVIDGGNGLNFVETLTPNSGERFNGALGLPGARLALFSGAVGGSSSDRVDAFGFTGSEWKATDSAGLPQLLGPQTQLSTLFYYRGHPFLDNDPRLLLLQPQDDWTRKADDNDDLPPSVISANFVAGTGLAGESAVGTSPPASADYLLVNQFAPTVSITARQPNLALLVPDLLITPEEASQAATFLARAAFDIDRYQLFYREAGLSGWNEYTGPIPVSYSGTWEFFLEEIATGQRGPITSKAWTVGTSQLSSSDLDEDGVPDFVERELGLDPLGGADSDGDGASDLEEILANTDPANAASRPLDADDTNYRDRPFTGDGFRLFARAFDGSASGMDIGQSLSLYSSTGRFFDDAQVESITAHPNLGNVTAARLFVENAQPRKYLFALSTPLFFDAAAAGSGREMVRFIKQPAHTPPSISPALTGTDRGSDAAAWIAAAQTAYTNYDPVTQVDSLNPSDSALSVALELGIYDILIAENILDSVGPTEFSLMPWRAKDVARQGLTEEQIDALIAADFSFEKYLDALQAEFDSPNTFTQDLMDLADALHQKHVNDFATDPSIPLPIDALRDFAVNGSLPGPVAGVVSAAELANAATAMGQLRALSADALRPTTTWIINVPASSAGPGVYERLDTTVVQLLDGNGLPLPLEQEFGLEPGTSFSVRGYTDVTAASGLPAMEAIRILSVTTVAASENDQDGNLLDDEWENFYFGSTGQDPYANNGLSDHSYLQHFLGGTDPRSEVPSGAPVDLSLPQPAISQESDGDIILTWEFPSDFQEGIDFSVEESTDLSGFVPHAGPSSPEVVGDTLELNLGPEPDLADAKFYKLVMSLAGN